MTLLNMILTFSLQDDYLKAALSVSSPQILTAPLVKLFEPGMIKEEAATRDVPMIVHDE